MKTSTFIEKLFNHLLLCIDIAMRQSDLNLFFAIHARYLIYLDGLNFATSVEHYFLVCERK